MSVEGLPSVWSPTKDMPRVRAALEERLVLRAIRLKDNEANARRYTTPHDQESKKTIKIVGNDHLPVTVGLNMPESASTLSISSYVSNIYSTRAT